MRNHSKETFRSFHRESGIPRTLTCQKPVGAGLKESEIRVGKYKYDPKDELGKGFSGKVYKAVQIVKQHKRYAIKVVDLKKFKGSNLDMLDNEIEIHKSLDHDCIVKLHEVIKTAHNYYLVMEYCPHGNLNEYIAQKKYLSEGHAIQIVNQIISAYKYLLAQGIIHRDIKPANILRMGNKWKISDFGFAARSRFGFKDRMSVGTPLYMAPETLKRNFYSYKSDLYAIGVVLFQMLTGETPHEARSERELLEKITQQVVLPKNLKNPKLIDFLTKMLIISDAKRMQKQQFESFDFEVQADAGLQTSTCNSVLSYSLKGSMCDDSLFKCNSGADLNSKLLTRDNSSKQLNREGPKHVHFQQASKGQKNPMLQNQQILTLQFQFVHHYYNLIQNIDSLHLDENTKGMLLLTLFKLLLKKLRLLCDKNQNYLNLNNWEEYKQCKLYQQLYSEFTVYSEKYEKEYLQFIKHNDIKVIRAVNRKFPELCSTSPLTSKFYENLKIFIGNAIKQHDNELNNLLMQGQQLLNDRFEALGSIYTIYKLTKIRSNSPRSALIGERPNLLADYTESKLTKSDYHNLKRLIKNI